MVKNYPESYKGVLASAYKDAAYQNTLPLFYSLFFRFDSYAAMIKSLVTLLLKVAQNTYQPENYQHNGLDGTKDNRYYKRAVSTEILRNAFSNGNERNYIMHGTWNSVWDHENSHLDKRFQMAAAPVGSFVINGPVEPFYETII